MAAPTNIEQLRNQLCDAFDMLKHDPRRIAQTCELANVAGKVIASCKLEFEVAVARKEQPDIPFLKYRK